MLHYEIKVPTISISAKLDRKAIVRAGARAGVKWLKRRLRAGTDYQFNPLPQAKDKNAKKPGIRSKQLINSIKVAQIRKSARKGKGAMMTIAPRGRDKTTGVPNATKAGWLADRHGSIIKADATMDKIMRQAMAKALKRELAKKKVIQTDGYSVIESKGR